MAEIKNLGESTFPIKRKPDFNSEDNESFPNKSQKLETLETDHQLSDSNDEPQQCTDITNSKHTTQTPNDDSCSLSEDKNIKQGITSLFSDADNDQEPGCDNDGVEDDERLKEKNELDNKGKAVRRDDKGKGKMIVEEGDDGDDEDDDDSEDDDDDDDSSDDGELSDADSDLSDDPLTEVDLENILPSRTRRRSFHPGVYIADDIGNDDDDESDDGKD